jgi:uncharacterized protein (TIGR03083 family)
VTDSDPTLSALASATSRVSTLLRSTDDLAVRVPHLEWTVGDVGAHLVSIARAYTTAIQDGLAVGPDVTKGDENNARLIASTPERSRRDIADALDVGTAAFVAANAPLSRQQAVPFYGDLTVTAGCASKLLLYDWLVHGWDLATTLGHAWNINARDARLALDAFPEILPHIVKDVAASGFTATYEMRIRGSQPYFLVFNDGVLTVSSDRGTRRVDCRISAAPSPYLLVSAGRGSQWRPVLTGRIVTYGRRPWLVNKFKSIFGSP